MSPDDLRPADFPHSNWPDEPWPRFLNRELSWLDFGSRVLSLAEDQERPLLDRTRFIAIFASILDEFYQVRVAGLKRQKAAGVATRSPDGISPAEQLSAINEKARPMVRRHSHLFLNEIMPALAKAGIHIVHGKDLDSKQRTAIQNRFEKDIFPVVTPLAVGAGHPFPYISNLSLNLAVVLSEGPGAGKKFARVKLPPVSPRFVHVEANSIFVPLEDVIAANLHKLFPGMEIVEHHTFRVTRDNHLAVNDEDAEDLLETLEQELRKPRFPAVRLEIEESMPAHVLDLLLRELQVDESDVHDLVGPLSLSSLYELDALERPDLKEKPLQPYTHPSLHSIDGEDADVFSVLKTQDVLVHHPYQSFATSVQRFIEQSASDPDVLAIKMTLYRTSGVSSIADALMDAAKAGKQVVVLVEIQARFDEQANIAWARALEQSGCHVMHGLVGLKTHCKLCLVIRREQAELVRYVHVGTGNYNPQTARTYEDLSLLTADVDIGADASDLFNYLTGYSRQPDYRSLVVAPHDMRERLLQMIRRETQHAAAGHPARIVIKVNALVDEQVIEELYGASGQGVRIDLIVRSICCLRPEVENLSEHISVRSVLGRFLEHSRIFYFLNGGEEELYIGSADLMPRNLDGRVEVLAPITRKTLISELKHILDLALADNTCAWALGPDGNWIRATRAEGDDPRALQDELGESAAAHRARD